MQDDIRGFVRLASAVGQSLAERVVDAADAVAAATGLDRVVQPRRVVNHLAGLAESVVVAADAARRQAVGAVTGRPTDDALVKARLSDDRGVLSEGEDVGTVARGVSPAAKAPQPTADAAAARARRPSRAAVRARAQGVPREEASDQGQEPGAGIAPLPTPAATKAAPAGRATKQAARPSRATKKAANAGPESGTSPSGRSRAKASPTPAAPVARKAAKAPRPATATDKPTKKATAKPLTSKTTAAKAATSPRPARPASSRAREENGQ